MLSSQCRSNTSLAGTQTREVTATGLTSPSSLQRRPFHGLSLLLLAVLAGGAVTPVHGGLMDFAPPGIIQYGTCSQPKAHESFHFRQVSPYMCTVLEEGKGWQNIAIWM